MPTLIRRLLGDYASVPRGIWVIFTAQVINRMGDFVAPFLSLFLTLKIGASPETAGVFLMATSLSSMFGALVGGKLADKYGRRRVLAAFQGMAGIFVGFCGFLDPGMIIPFVLIVANFFQGSVKPILSAMTADLTAPEQRRTAFSLSYLGINLGVAIGPLIAAFLFNNALHWLFWADAFSSFIAVFLVLRFIPETMPGPRGGAVADNAARPELGTETAQQGSAVRAFIRHPVLLVYGLLFMISQIAYMQINFALPLYTQVVDPVHGTTVFGALASCNAVTVLLTTALVIRITKKAHAANVMSFGMLLITGGFAMMFFHLSVPLLFVSTILWSIGEVAFTTMAGAYVSTHSPENMRARFQSFVSLFGQAGNLMSPLIVGFVLQFTGLYNIWIFIAGLALIGVFGFRYLHSRDRVSEKAENAV